MQKVVEFKTRNFWSSQLNLDTLNEEIKNTTIRAGVLFK